jgi:hypothetical protein
MTTAIRKESRSSARETQRRLPRLDTARAPLGLEGTGEPFASLIAERKRLFTEALHARSAAERADLEVRAARERDREAFEKAALEGAKDPGRKHELKALKDADEAQRVAIGLTRASNTATRKVRAAIDGSAGDEAIAKVNALIDADLEKVKASVETALGDLGTALARDALLDSITTTRKAEHVTLKAKPPAQPEFLTVLERLLSFDPREEVFGER